jgi:hypothetical protein
MDIATKKFPNGLPTLEELKKYNSSDVPAETAWIWGKDDEVRMTLVSCLTCSNEVHR